MPLKNVLTADWLYQNYMAGLSKTDDDNVDWYTAQAPQALANAISTVENEFDFWLAGVRLHRERHNRVDFDGESWHLKRLVRRPVLAVTKLQWKYGNFDAATLPTSFVDRISRLMGDVRIVPSSDSIESSAVSALSYFYHQGVHHMAPGLWRFSYLYGFEDRRREVPIGTFASPFYLHGPLRIEPSIAPAVGQTFTAVISGNLLSTTAEDGVGAADTETLTWTAGDFYPKESAKSWSRLTSVVLSESAAAAPTFDMEGTVSPWPVILEDCIGLIGAMLPLDTAGDLLVGAGIASSSTSFDGLSVSKNTTASATNHGLGAKVKNYQERLKRNVERLRRRTDRREAYAI